MSKRQDLGRQACYRAEAFLFQSYDVALNQEELLQYCKDIHETHGDGKKIPTLEFTHRLGGGMAYPFFRKICLPSKGSTLMVLIHELAHVYSPVGEGHGPIWRRTYVNLVRNVVGNQEADALIQSFASHQVPIDAEKDGWIRRKETRPRKKFQVTEREIGPSYEATSSTGTRYHTYDRGPEVPSEIRIRPDQRNFLRQKGTYLVMTNAHGKRVEIRLREIKREVVDTRN